MIDMELPDKIYVTTYSINSRYGNRFGCWTERECPGYAYIRKDALLEWAKEELSKASVSSDSIGRRNAFIDVIDKLNFI